MEKNQKEEFLPIIFEFMIGGFSQGHFRVEFKDGGLFLEPSFSSDRVSDHWGGEVIPTPFEWKIFWNKVNDLQVWKWKKNYSDNDICDGTQWSLKIKFNGKTKESYGSNSYPKSFNKFLKTLSSSAFKAKDDKRHLLSSKCRRRRKDPQTV